MSKKNVLPRATARLVGRTCLCLHVQRAARALARRFDEAFRPVGLTNTQFSLLMALNRPRAPNMRQVSDVLAMDRTTVTANLKPLERRGLVRVSVDSSDKRSRRLALTAAGLDLLARVLPAWRRTHDAIERDLAPADPDRLRETLRAMAGRPENGP